MRAEAERYPIAAWKSYTHVGRPWRLDDDTGEAFLALVEEIGPPIVCVHKGLGGDPSDVGPAAAAHPDISFVAYHSGYETSVGRRAPTRPGSPNGGVDRLLESVRGGRDRGRAATCTPSSAARGACSWATPTRPRTCSAS